MISSVTIIGTGTLGGHLCKHLAENSQIDTLNLIDRDYVDNKDTEIGIFRPFDMYDLKVDVLEEMFSTYNVKINKIATFYEDFCEGYNDLPKADLTIDCRNMFGKRNKNIDLKMFITDRFLIFDFQKEYKNDNITKGEYIIKLTKDEISRAAYYASNLICSRYILDAMIESQSIKYLDIDVIQSLMLKNIDQINKNPDCIYDFKDTKRFIGVNEIIQPIIDKNQTFPLKISVKEKQPEIKEVLEIPDLPEKNYKIIPQGTLKCPDDVIENLKQAIKNKNKSTRFMTVLMDDQIYILQETGGA